MSAPVSGTTGLIDQWLKSVLGSDATLLALGMSGVWKGVAPEGTVPPYIVLIDQSGVDTTGMATNYVLTTQAYLIRCTHQADTDVIPVQMGHRVKHLVQGVGPGLYQDGYVYAAQRLSVQSFVEVDQGLQWRHYGQTFHIWVTEGP